MSTSAFHSAKRLRTGILGPAPKMPLARPFDVQLVAHPGYNQDRGPVAVFSVRTHVDF